MENPEIHKREEEFEDEDDDDDDDDYLMTIDSLCLWCADVFPNPEDAFKHCAEVHQFSIQDFVKQHQLEFYDYVRFVNFCRKTKVSAEKVMTGEEIDWDSDEFLLPVLENDGLLMFDLESIIPDSNGQDEGSGDNPSTADRTLEVELKLHHALEQIENMRQTTQALFSGMAEPVNEPTTSIRSLHEDEDNTYFGSYGHFSIHHEMLKDRARTEFYKRCIEENRELFKDAVVLDVGCGTGILSLLAAQHGAKQVIAVEMSEIIYQAMDIAKENNLDKQITFVKGRIEDVTLPVDEVDIIISEWMGYFLLFESMLDSVLWARDHYLRPDGLLIPSNCRIYLAALSDPQGRAETIDFWNDVYSFKMSCMKSGMLEEASVATVLPEHVVSSVACIKELDLCTCQIKDLDFCSSFTFVATKTSSVTAVAGYFDVRLLSVHKEQSLSTDPQTPPTHWKQTVFHLESPLELQKGEEVQGTLKCRKNRKDPRSLIVSIKLGHISQTFHIQ